MSGRRLIAPAQFTPSGDVPSLRDLREKQAQFARERNKLDIQNSWLAIGALAPAAIGLGMEAPSLLAFGRIGSALRVPLTSFPELESWQNASQLEARIGRSLTEAEKTALRRLARSRYAQANGMAAKAMTAQVHHSDPLEYAHLKPKADPNRLANLWALEKDAHDIATNAWRAFSKGLGGRTPTQAELMAQKLRVDKMVEPYIRRPGLSRPPTPPAQGGKP